MASSLEAMRREGTRNSTEALMDAVRSLEQYGLSPEEAIVTGMGRFPVGGLAFYRDDFHEPRLTPTPHPHMGTDIFAAFDTPVRSPANGIVTFAEEGAGGKAAYVTEPDGTWYYLAHLNGFAPDLPSGSAVRVGQIVGFNGDTGNAKGGAPHVHFEIHPQGGAAVNPKPILDQWLAEAIAAVPALLEPFRQAAGQPGLRPLTAVGLVRHLDRGMLSRPFRVDTAAAADRASAERLAEAVVSPLTPSVLRRDGP